MASMGQAAAAADHHLHQLPSHLNGISRLNCSPPPGALNSIPISAFSNLGPNDYDHHHHHHRDKYMMEMHSGYHRDRFQRNVGSSPGYNTSNEIPQQVWPLSGPNGDMHVHPPQENTILGTGPSPIGMVGNERGCSEQQQIARGSPRVLSSSTPELYHGSGVVVSAGGDWDQFMDSNLRYNPCLLSSSPSLQHSQNSSHLGGNDGAMIRELIGRLEGNGNGVPSLVSSPQHSCSTTTTTPPPPPPSAGIDKALKLQGNAWNSSGDVASHNMGLTVDPSKGGLALQGVGLPTSHCLPHFPSDPGFVERAARFSSFSNGNYSQPFPTSSSSDAAAAATTTTTGKTRPRQSSAQDNNNNHHSSRQLQKTSSSISMNEIINSGVKGSKENLIPLDNDGAAHETGEGVADDMERDAREGGEAEAKAAGDNKKLCRTASSSLAGIDENHGMQAGGVATPAAVDEANDAADAELLLQQQNPAAPADMSSVEDARGETCPSGVTHVSTAGGNKESPMKKRKGSLDDKSKDTTTSATVSSPANKTSDSDDVKAKRFKREDGSKVDKDADVKPKVERSSSETSGESSPRSAKEQSKPQEPPKQDYIHVRARRGQATDSHSLAERVRREKISERMKFLQDLVPGCSKVTGKAVMLDEIINYVQSLQRQVEHLSMKLAAVSPRLDFNIESLLAKEVSRSSRGMIMGPETPSYPQLHHPQLQQHHQQQHGVAAPPCGLQYPPVQSLGNNPSQLALRRTISAPIPALIPRGDDGFGNCLPQGIWDDGELQSIVQMGFGHLRSLSSQALLHAGQLPPGHMKVEL